MAFCRGFLATSGVATFWQAHGQRHAPDVLCSNEYLFILLNIIYHAVGVPFHPVPPWGIAPPDFSLQAGEVMITPHKPTKCPQMASQASRLWISTQYCADI